MRCEPPKFCEVGSVFLQKEWNYGRGTIEIDPNAGEKAGACVDCLNQNEGRPRYKADYGKICTSDTKPGNLYLYTVVDTHLPQRESLFWRFLTNAGAYYLTMRYRRS